MSHSSRSTPSGLSGQPGISINAIPRYVQFISPVSLGSNGTDGERCAAQALPLNLIAHIVSYLDNAGDLARVTRSSRLLYYMALPLLYQNVDLHSYRDIRYVNGRPEGYGSGSPFVMALDGLVSKSHAGLVRSLRLWGQWSELGVEAFERGRVPDSNMMLNILLRVATERTDKLRSFSWELDCKPHKMVYNSLAMRDTLTSLTIKFPSSRQPRPVVVIPTIENLLSFHAIDIDPLCYPDDISLLLLGAKKLKDLRLHFSPRMRAEAESSLSMHVYFGRCFKAGHVIPLEHFAMQNWYGSNVVEMGSVFDFSLLKSVTFFNVFGGATGDYRTAFIDETWQDSTNTHGVLTSWSSCRTNEMAGSHVNMIGATTGMKEVYFVSAQTPKSGFTPDSANGELTPATPVELSGSLAVLGRDYIKVLKQQHGQSLRRLLLSAQWALSADEICDIVRCCPNLEQFGVAVDSTSQTTFRLLLPFIPRLQALRILHNEHVAEYLSTVSDEERMDDIGRDLSKIGAKNLRYVGLGKSVYHIWEADEVDLPDGVEEFRRNVTLVTWDDVQHIELWKYDCLDLSVDPKYPR